MKWTILLAALCIGCALGEKEKVLKAKSKLVEPKLKREAPIRGGSSYHGPSYKYLPPSSSSHVSHFVNDHHSISGDKGGYNLGNLISEGTHGHSPKVETYIVQTESTPESYGGGSHGGSNGHVSAYGFGNFHGLGTLNGLSSSHRGSHGSIGYKYALPSASYSNSHIGNSNSFGSSYAVGHGPVHNIKTVVIPAHGFSTDGHGSSGYTRFGSYSAGHSLPKDFTSGSHYSQYAGNEHVRQGSDYTSGYNAGHSSGSDYSGANGYHSYEHGNDASYRETDYSSGQGQDSYSYEAPSQTYSHSHSHSAPSVAHGVPDMLSPPYHSGSAGHQAPTYAVGHKGLGHFGYSASRPQALNTNFIDSSKYGGSFTKYEHGSRSSAHDVSKAPFKPSLFLGASHEGGSTTGSISSEYGPPTEEQSISQDYLPPPTSEGYDYQTPSSLYGAPMNSHTHAYSRGSAHSYEPENTYLPPSLPQTSYGPPATPDQSYLPPQH